MGAKAARLKAALESGIPQAKRRKIGDMGTGVETAAMAGGTATALEAAAGTIAVKDRGAGARKKNVDGQAAKPKQVPNGYMLFTQSQKAAAAAAGQSSLPHEHTKQIALKWRQLSQAERDYWNAQSKQLREH